MRGPVHWNASAKLLIQSPQTAVYRGSYKNWPVLLGLTIILKLKLKKLLALCLDITVKQFSSSTLMFISGYNLLNAINGRILYDKSGHEWLTSL